MTEPAADAAPAAAPHRPVVGFTRRLLGPLHVTGIFWYRLHYIGALLRPPWLLDPFILGFSIFFFLAMGRIRGAVAANLDPVLGPASWWTRMGRAFRTLYAFAHCLSERYRHFVAPGSIRFRVEGEPHWRAAITGGRGAVLVTAHIGPWEGASHLGTEQGQHTVHVVREEEIDERAQAFIRGLIARAGGAVVTHFANEDSLLPFRLAEALRKGELVALQGDRPRAGGRSVATTIFGKPFPLPVGPAALARSAGVPLVPLFTFREGRLSARTVIRPPIEVARTANREADLKEAVERFAREIEWAIRERPYQWFCFRKLWD